MDYAAQARIEDTSLNFTESQEKPWSTLAQTVCKRTYSRDKGDGSLENWREIVYRVIEGNVGKYRGTDLLEKNEEDRLFYYLYNRKAMPAGRGLWFSGTEAQKKLGGIGLNNCFHLTADEWRNFAIAQDMLMLGGGVGMSVEHKFVSKLPRIKKTVKITNKETKDADFIVPDSREGWVELTRKVLKSFFETGKSFTYSTVLVRGAGEPIKGFGGTASGKIPLIKFVEKITGILAEREGKSIRPIDALDLICCIGEMVVAGNVRRSALIVQGDCWDKEFLRAKRWDLGTIPTQRAMANLSVVCDDIEDVHPAFWETYQNGEPYGIVNLDNMRKYGRIGELRKDPSVTGTNPCVTKDTFVTTEEGVFLAGQLLNKSFDALVDGYSYASTDKGFFVTGNKKTIVLHLSSGRKLEVTDNHQIMTPHGWTEAGNLDIEDTVVINNHSKAVLNIDKTSPEYARGYLLGSLVGDGNTSDQCNAQIKYWGENKKEYRLAAKNLLAVAGWGSVHHSDYSSEKSPYQAISSRPLYDFAASLGCLKESKKLSKEAATGSWSYLSGLVCGYFDADGTVLFNKVKGSSVRLASADLTNLEIIQNVLSSLGINSRIYKNRKDEGFRMMPDAHGGYKEYYCRAGHELCISRESILRFNEVIGFRNKDKQDKLELLIDSYVRTPYKTRYIDTIIDIEEGSIQEVVDCTIPEVSAFDANGVYVHNCGEVQLAPHESCNLTEIFLPNLKDEKEFIEAGKLMYRWAKRVSCEDYHLPQTDAIVKKNRRLGGSITGCLQAMSLFNEEVLDRVYKAIREEDVAYSKKLGVPESIRLTTNKPSGTLSLLGDVTAGIHPAYSKYYIRRTRFSAIDPLIPILKEAGYKIEPVVRFDGSYDHETLVVDFPCKAPEGTPVADEGWDTWKQLEVLKMVQKYWSDNSVSVTVYYKREEVPQIKEWLRENLKELKSISFLCHSEHGFKQAPYEAITEDEYLAAVKPLKPVDIDSVGAAPDVDVSDCESGVCPIK